MQVYCSLSPAPTLPQSLIPWGMITSFESLPSSLSLGWGSLSCLHSSLSYLYPHSLHCLDSPTSHSMKDSLRQGLDPYTTISLMLYTVPDTVRDGTGNRLVEALGTEKKEK